MQDPLLVEALRKLYFEMVSRWESSYSGQEAPGREMDAAIKHWTDIRPLRDGPVKPVRTEVADAEAMSEEIKKRAIWAGGDDIGITALRPEFIELGVAIPHESVIAIICYEDYAKSLDVEQESMTTYAKYADISTEIARYIREDLGYPTLAHHNGPFQIQAIPLFHEVGFSKLGRHGSLIHPELGANLCPGIVTTDLPLAYDQLREFGVQNLCMNCNLCRTNSPGDAFPYDFIMTGNIRRWLTDIDKCYQISRFREAYSHICIDVCPYIYKENGDPEKRGIIKEYMKVRKDKGYKTPKGNA